MFAVVGVSLISAETVEAEADERRFREGDGTVLGGPGRGSLIVADLLFLSFDLKLDNTQLIIVA